MNNRKHQAILCLLIVLFISVKFNSLFLPYFWDEAWSYIPAIIEMARNGPTIVPYGLNPEVFKGHPLFFYFLGSSWFNIIGGTLFSMHSFALLISILTFISFYKLCQIYLNNGFALFGVALLAIQEAFFVQSSFVLPEILLCLATLETIRNYLLNRKYWFFLSAGVLTLTKEVGLVVLISIFIYHLFINRKDKMNYFWLALSAMPPLLFYTLQKIIYGWFFFPLHLGFVKYSLQSLIDHSAIIFKFLFIYQGRFIFLVFALICLILKYNTKFILKIAYFILVILFIISIYFKLFILFPIYVVSFILIMKKLINYKYLATNSNMLFIIIILNIVFFTAINFLMLRYLLLIFPIIILLFLILISKCNIKTISINYGLGLLIIWFVLSMVRNIKFKEWHDDASANYINAVKIHKQTISFCEENTFFDKNIFTHFLLQNDFTNKNLGYLTSKSEFKRVDYIFNTAINYDVYIFSCIELDESKYQAIKSDSNYYLVKRWDINKAWSEIYALKDK